MSYLPDISFQTHLFTFSKISIRVWAAIFGRHIHFLELAFVLCFRPNSYTRMRVLTVGSFCFLRKVTNHCETPVASWLFGFSLETIFIVIWIIYRGLHFGGGGPPPGPQGARRDMYREFFSGWGTTHLSLRCLKGPFGQEQTVFGLILVW